MRITQCKFKRFQQFAQRWLTNHVSTEQHQQCNDWLLGNTSSSGSSNNNSSATNTTTTTTATVNNWSLCKTKVIVQNDLKKTPYRPYQRYKVLNGSGVSNLNSMNATSNVYNTLGGSNNIIISTVTAANVSASQTNTTSNVTTSTVTAANAAAAAGVNLNTLASVTAINSNEGTTNATNLAPTPHCNSVAGLAQTSAVVVQEQPAQVRPMES